MLFLVFFFALHFHNVAYFKNKSRQSAMQGGGMVEEAVVGHGKWVLRGFWLMATVTLEG